MKRVVLGFVVFVALLVAAGFGSLALQHLLSPSAQCLDLGGSWNGETGQCVGSDYPLPE